MASREIYQASLSDNLNTQKYEHLTVILMVLWPYFTSAHKAARNGPCATTDTLENSRYWAVSKWQISTSVQRNLDIEVRTQLEVVDNSPHASNAFGLSWKITKPPVIPRGMSSRLKKQKDKLQHSLEKRGMERPIYFSLTSTRLEMRPLEIVSWTLAFLKTKWSDPLVYTIQK